MMDWLKGPRAQVALLGALLAVAWGWLMPAWDGLMTDWHDASQHMEYVWLVPLLVGGLLWARRKRLVAAAGPGEPWLACLLLVPAGALLFLGLRGGQTRFSEMAAVLLLWAIALATYGRRMLKETWFPLALFLFVIPVGFLDNWTVPLRRASVSVTACLLNGLGIGVRQVGTAIVAKGQPFFQLDVADPCSGIRSLVALFVGTAAYGAFRLTSARRRAVLFLSSVPIAFLGNILRLLLTALTCHLISQSAGMVLHDNALFIVAPVYAGLVFALTDWLARGEKPAADPEPLPAAPGVRWAGLTRGGWAGLAVMVALLLSIRYAAGLVPPLTFESDAFLQPRFVALPTMTQMRFPRFCQNRACLWSKLYDADAEGPSVCPICGGEVSRVSRAELDILPADTQSRKVTYTLQDGSEFTVSLVIAGRQRISIHRPELCLPAQGYVMSARAVRQILPGWPMACFSLTREGQLGRSGFAYVFLNADKATVSNFERVLGDVWERSLHNRIRRWAMVTVSSPQHDFQTPEGEAALRDFMAQLAPTLRATPEATP